MAKKIIESWDRRSAAYERLTERYPVFRRLAERLVDCLPEGFSGTAVDLAGGTGLVTSVLLDRFPEARAAIVEPAPGMLELAQKRLAGRPVDFRGGCAEDVDLLSISADAVLCSASFHLFDEARVMTAVGRSLPTGGLFVFNLWDHALEGFSSGDMHAAWRGPVAKALEEAGERVPAWEGLPQMPQKARRDLEKAGRSALLVLKRTEVDEDEVRGTFWLDFMAMSPNWPKRGLGEKREGILERARALAEPTEPLRTVRFVFRKASPFG